MGRLVMWAPYILCGGEEHIEMKKIAFALLFLFVIPLPILSFVRYYRAHKRDSKELLSTIKDPHLWWWNPVVMNGRRLVIALLVGLLPWQNAWLSPMVTLLLLGILLAVMSLHPYKNRWDNVLESSSMTTAILLFTANLAESTSNNTGLLVLVSIGSIGSKFLAVLVIVMSFASGTSVVERFLKSMKQRFQPDDDISDILKQYETVDYQRSQGIEEYDTLN